MELQVAFRELLTRLPGLRLVDEVEWSTDTAAQVPQRMLIGWTTPNLERNDHD